MPVSPSGVSGISACHFRTCLSLDEFWIIRVGPATFRQALKSKTTKTPSMLQACSFFRLLSWNSAFQPPCLLPSSCSKCLSKHWHTENSRESLQRIVLEPEILWKRWFAWAFHKGFFSCNPNVTWIWTYKTHDLTDNQLTVGSFLPAITFMWSDRQIPAWPQFVYRKYFPLCPPWFFSIALYFSKFPSRSSVY